MLVFSDFVERFERFFGIVDIMMGKACFLRAFFKMSHRKRRARAGLLFLREQSALGGSEGAPKGLKETPKGSRFF